MSEPNKKCPQCWYEGDLPCWCEIYNQDNQKAECNCFGALSESEIIFFDLKCQCKNDNTKKENHLSRYEYFYNRYFNFYNGKSKNQLVDLIASYEAMKAVRGGPQ